MLQLQNRLLRAKDIQVAKGLQPNPKKLHSWRKKRGLSRTGGAINIAEHMDQADIDEELLEIMLAKTILNEESEKTMKKDNKVCCITP